MHLGGKIEAKFEETGLRERSEEPEKTI